MAVGRLRGERVTLRPLETADIPRLAEIAREPDVARWWPGLGEQDLVELARPEEEAFVFTVELDGETIGLAQVGEETDPDYRHASVDSY